MIATLLVICSGLELESLAQIQVCVNNANCQTITAKSCKIRFLNIANLFCSILCHHYFHGFFNCYPLVVLLSPSFLHLIYPVPRAFQPRGKELRQPCQCLRTSGGVAKASIPASSSTDRRASASPPSARPPDSKVSGAFSFWQLQCSFDLPVATLFAAKPLQTPQFLELRKNLRHP